MASVRPFKFKNLPRLRKEQVAFNESLATYLSQRPFRPGFGETLAQVITQVITLPCEFSRHELRPVDAAGLAALLPAVGCMAVIGMAPGEHKILVDLDSSLTALVIERLLGGSGQTARLLRPLTDIESGVLSFVLLKVLSHFHDGWQSGREMALTLDRFAGSYADVRAYAEAEADYQMVGVSIGLGSRTGYARVFVPHALITKRFAKPAAQSDATPQELAYMRQRLMSMGEQAVTARLTVTRLDLGARDIANVEPGDIILLENHQLQKTSAGIEGHVFVTVGLGKNGGFSGRLRNDGEQVQLEVVEIVTQEQPLEESMAEEHNEEDADNLPETEGLLRDVDASVVVELGRIRMNTAQVARLRKGQLLRLARGPNDPVDLVVNGKLFARGELVEVEGELGVRLIQVAGSE